MRVLLCCRSRGGTSGRHLPGEWVALLPAVPYILGVFDHGHAHGHPDLACATATQQMRQVGMISTHCTLPQLKLCTTEGWLLTDVSTHCMVDSLLS